MLKAPIPNRRKRARHLTGRDAAHARIYNAALLCALVLFAAALALVR